VQGKQLEVLREMAARIVRVACLFNVTPRVSPSWQ
jgi:hypothetical protein